jgi:hypothetical protein
MSATSSSRTRPSARVRRETAFRSLRASRGERQRFAHAPRGDARLMNGHRVAGARRGQRAVQRQQTLPDHELGRMGISH